MLRRFVCRRARLSTHRNYRRDGQSSTEDFDSWQISVKQYVRIAPAGAVKGQSRRSSSVFAPGEADRDGHFVRNL
jgi:hypothetical protein